jgi:hypothetical protein
MSLNRFLCIFCGARDQTQGLTCTCCIPCASVRVWMPLHDHNRKFNIDFIIWPNCSLHPSFSCPHLSLTAIFFSKSRSRTESQCIVISYICELFFRVLLFVCFLFHDTDNLKNINPHFKFDVSSRFVTGILCKRCIFFLDVTFGYVFVPYW